MKRYRTDQVAIIGVGSTGFSRDAKRSQLSLAAEAATKAILDAGLTKDDIDGVCGVDLLAGERPKAWQMAAMLGLGEVTYYSNQWPPIGTSIVEAMNAIIAGACSRVLVYNAVWRLPFSSRLAAADPFRQSMNIGSVQGIPTVPEEISGPVSYAAWASRYFHEFGIAREQLGLIALNARRNALTNPLAVWREPLTMDQYLNARMVREPLSLYDMDMHVDGADAFVLCRADLAQDSPQRPVYIHAAALGMIGKNDDDQIPGLDNHGHQVVVRALKERCDFWIPDVDVYFPYDGFSFLTLSWIENSGWCGPGEAGSFLQDSWNDSEGRLFFEGRVPINPHGGSLAEGGTQGSGHVREATMQLRRTSYNQSDRAERALLTIGGMMYNSQALMLVVK